MIFHKSSYNDIVKYYKNNIVKLKETGDRLWRISAINPSEVTLEDVDGFELTMDLNEEYEVDFPLPGRAWFQMGDKAAFLYRKPARQYNRGISDQNTGLAFLRSEGVTSGLSISLANLQQFVDKPSYQTVDAFKDGYMSLALSPNFAIAKGGSVFCNNTIIGQCSLNDKVVSVHPIFKSDIKKLMEGFEVC